MFKKVIDEDISIKTKHLKLPQGDIISLKCQLPTKSLRIFRRIFINWPRSHLFLSADSYIGNDDI